MISYNATAAMLTTIQQILRNPILIALMTWEPKAPSNITAINAMSWVKSYYPGTTILSTITWSHTPPQTSPPPNSKITTETVSGPVCERCLTLLHLTVEQKIREGNSRHTNNLYSFGYKLFLQA